MEQIIWFMAFMLTPAIVMVVADVFKDHWTVEQDNEEIRLIIGRNVNNENSELE